MERERKSRQFEKIAENLASARGDDKEEKEERKEIMSQDEWERRSREFQKILEVPSEERDRIQRMQVVDRAAAAIAAARALLKENVKADDGGANVEGGNGGNMIISVAKMQSLYSFCDVCAWFCGIVLMLL